jgi:hypothetical protein
MAHHLIMLCSSLTRSHCLFISIHPCLSHNAVIAVVALTLLSPSPLPLPPHKLSPLQPPPLPPLLPPSPLRWLLPLPSPVGCCMMEGGWRLLIFVFFFRCWFGCWCWTKNQFGVRACQKSKLTFYSACETYHSLRVISGTNHLKWCQWEHQFRPDS